MAIEGWNGEAGGPRWWARVLSFAAVLGAILGVVGPFGSFLNGGLLIRLVHWVFMTVLGTAIAGLLVPLSLRLGVRAGLPRLFSLAVGLLVAAVPISVLSAVVARGIWPTQTAALGPADWYSQALLIETGVLVLWILVETARRSRGRPATADQPLSPESRSRARPGLAGEPAICLQMEDHYVRVHRGTGSTLELMPLHEAIERFGQADGLQVHRGWWVASQAVVGAERQGRNWRLRLGNGLLAPVARNRIGEARARGWIGDEPQDAAPRADPLRAPELPR